MAVNVDQPLVDAYGDNVRNALSVTKAVREPDEVPPLDTDGDALKLDVSRADEETLGDPLSEEVMEMDPEALLETEAGGEAEDDMETWGEFESALLGVTTGVSEPVMEVDADEEMKGDTVPVTLPEPVETVLWVGESVLATVDDEVTEIVAVGEVVERELQVVVTVKLLVGVKE